MKHLKCYYDQHMICEYLDQYGNEIYYGCLTCPHWKPTVPEPPISGRAKWGALALIIFAIVAMVFIIGHFINMIRP